MRLTLRAESVGFMDDKDSNFIIFNWLLFFRPGSTGSIVSGLLGILSHKYSIRAIIFIFQSDKQ
ncbi:Uncharacterised protein [Yersinia enterocolitica]|nr:hypothetical protein CH47_2709 [Yersinia enterocolitica]VTP89280.1 Uncharacterised protein [Yersinia enterocolitica subsp. enterocolitica]KGA78338.1 hypothetical protein DJ60_1832 [Yersinia enterocolitica]PNM14484.1 hypothetical protein A6J64_007995 [Yersinia enterocolitica]PNM17545.1 hypothetical protein A6J65_000665 [Yersinia enterocolitica]